MRWVVLSLVVHVALLAWLARRDEALVAWTPPQLPAFERADAATVVELLDVPAGGGGGGGAAAANSSRAARPAHTAKRSSDAWEQIAVTMDRPQGGEAGAGGGDGGGVGGGHGNGIGFGAGGGVRIADDVPAPPAPPPPPKVSKARPAKLVWPTRDEEVDDDASLFTAKITVDTDGDVVAAHILTLRIGAKADRAASAIWSFRYSPALDADGRPVQSTFEQSFQVR